MNRESILTNVPDDAHWATMSKDKKQPTVVDLAIAALTECAANGQELDAWEAQHLRSALGAIRHMAVQLEQGPQKDGLGLCCNH